MGYLTSLDVSLVVYIMISEHLPIGSLRAKVKCLSQKNGNNADKCGMYLCVCVCVCVCVQLLSHVHLFAIPWIVACQAPLFMRFPRQEYWNGLPFPSPGVFPKPGIEPASPALVGRFSTTEPPGKPDLSL